MTLAQSRSLGPGRSTLQSALYECMIKHTFHATAFFTRAGGARAEAQTTKPRVANDSALIETQDMVDKNFPSPADKATAWGRLVDLFLSEAGINSN
ncbi:hypothetical protein [Xanthobacter sp. 126]|uniref:hypothetical protein n=1 Tax=Xanthobacter sp. 126 TaxID=1131814 RepID=UPI0012DF5725|nr:hypothetical protein [Xanthobacter sp. 126]